MSDSTPLKYLFQVTYKDGSIYIQNPEDLSVKAPELGKSCFYDIEQEKVKSFFLSNDEHTYSVNLLDGHFEVDGVPFFMHPDRSLKGFRLVFFRQHTHDLDARSGRELSHVIAYQMGWQARDRKGQEVTRVMEFY